MRVEVDYARCEGHGMCEERAPKLFQLDDEGELIFSAEGRDIEPGDEADATAAVGVCPVAALKLLS